jgi:hypothetical protein
MREIGKMIKSKKKKLNFNLEKFLEKKEKF